MSSAVTKSSAPTNAPELTVSELAGALKRTIEDAFGHVRLRGEISGYRGPQASGHAYFCLKDRDARLDAVIWKGTFSRLRFKPQEGLEVVAIGRITTFPGKSTYQIVVESLEPAGVGALMALLEERRRKLTAEGLFAAERKRKPPFLPSVIGVVTSPTGSVIRDILHRLEDRFARHVIVWPVRVQGETCAAEVAAAIAGFNALPIGGPIPRPDLIIVARGGGSLEDLWGFNEEAVVRAAAESAIPLIAAIGHETDTTLIDHAADLRAPTPTGAAEMAVPVRADLLAQVGGLASRHADAMRRAIETGRAGLRSAARALPTPEALLAPGRQRLDLAAARLAPALVANQRDHERQLAQASLKLARHAPHLELAKARTRLDFVGDKPRACLMRGLADRRERLSELSARLSAGRDGIVRTERLRLERCRDRLGDVSTRAIRALAGDIARRRALLDAQGGMLLSLGYKSVLGRGFALVRDAEGRPVPRAADLSAGQGLSIEFADASRSVRVEGGEGTPKPARRNPPAPERSSQDPARRPDPARPLVQTTLFDI
jgi:exodeoxyribonuclease VII large subunit